MLTVPASNVSVLVVVMRTAVNTAASETSPPPIITVLDDCFAEWLDTQELPVIFTMVIVPETICAAPSVLTLNPEVELETEVDALICPLLERYPLVV